MGETKAKCTFSYSENWALVTKPWLLNFEKKTMKIDLRNVRL